MRHSIPPAKPSEVIPLSGSFDGASVYRSSFEPKEISKSAQFRPKVRRHER